MVKYLLLLVLLVGCDEIQKEVDKLEAPPTASATPVPPVVATPVEETKVITLAYMTKDQSKLLIDEMAAQLPNLDKASDDMAKRFCPNYKKLSPSQRAIAWSYLANAIIFRESGVKDGLFKKCSSMTESNGDVSEGLFQLTYGNKFCPKKKSEGDLCDTSVNIKCGAKLLGYFVGLDGVVTAGGYTKYGAPPKKGARNYWSVIGVPDTKSKHHLAEIMEKTAKAPGCK